MKLSGFSILALLGLVLTGLPTTPAAAQLAFASNHYVLGENNATTGPFPMLVLDVNGDGKPDIVCGMRNTGDQILVLTNNGSGGFAIENTFLAGSSPGGPEFIATLDVNGDGKPDVVCVNSGNNTLTILTNDGSGGFALQTTITTGNIPFCVAPADLNGDGRLALICANGNDNTLMVFTNNGTGGFGLNATLPTGRYPYHILVADLNGDGRPDLVCANNYDDNLTVFTNNGAGGFGFQTNLDVDIGPRDVIAADLNGHGKPDLIAANAGTPWYQDNNTLTVLTNDGHGNFALSATFTVGAKPFTVAAADLNGDGKLDLVSASYYAGTLTVLTNNGSGGFGFSTNLSVDVAGEVVAADVNGDGKPDLIADNQYDNTLTVLLNTTPWPVPPLGITTVNTLPVVVWPASATNFVLQMTTNLASGNWVTVTSGIPFCGVQITNAPAAAFFRLH